MNEAIIYYNNDGQQKSLLGLYTEDNDINFETNEEERKYKYQLQYHDNDIIPTMSKEVNERFYGNFITDTRVECLDNVESVELTGNIIKEVYENKYVDNDIINTKYGIYDKLEETRKHLLSEKLNNILVNCDIVGDFEMRDVFINSDGNIELNFLGNNYILEIRNERDYE